MFRDFITFQIENLTAPNSYANLDALYLPFGVAFKDDGIQFYKYADRDSERDEVWSLNMKKSLAALFQLKRNSFEEGAFTVKEVNQLFSTTARTRANCGFLIPICFASILE